jgi:hypothetical protein
MKMVRFAKIYSDQLDAIRTGSLPDQFVDTDWADSVLRQASIQNHNLSFTGGSENLLSTLSGLFSSRCYCKSKFKSERYNLSFIF